MRFRILFAFLLFSSLLLAQGAPKGEAPCTPSVQGDLKIHELTSKIFNNRRNIRVLLPPGYDAAQNNERHYPVLYMLDGQNLFDVCTGYGRQEWRMDEVLHDLYAAKAVPEMIVVGIDNAGAKRGMEYLPYKDYVGGQESEEPYGKKNPDFVVNEVMPFVDAHYRTLKGHDNTGIGGSSYGGVAAMYALMAKPSVFGYGLIESPVFWIGMGQLVRDTSPFCAGPRKIFMGFGGSEIDNEHMQKRSTDLVRQVESNLKNAGYNDSNLKVVIEPGAKHNEAAWAKRLPGALTFLFGEWKAPTK